VTTLRLVRVNLALRQPHVTGHGTESIRDVVLVSWTDPDGIEGWGECPTLSTFGYADEVTDTAWGFLRDVVGPVVSSSGRPPHVEGAPMAMGAVRDAMLDARLRADGRALWEWIGGRRRPLDTTTVISIGQPVPAHATAVKVKVTPGTLDGLRDLRAARPDLVLLAADANGSFPSADDVPDWIDDLGLAYLEQPLAPDDLAGSARLRDRLSTPIALDEAVVDRRSLARAIDRGALDVLSLKPARVGGIEVALELLASARAAGLPAFVGGMLETGIGRAGAAALASAEGIDLPTDLGPSDRYFEHDLCEPVEVDTEGRLVVPDDVGIGRVPDEAALEAATVDERRFSRRA
jgi:O-succinylbenzoate synthase